MATILIRSLGYSNSIYHTLSLVLLERAMMYQPCKPPIYESDRVFIASDLNLCYDLEHLNWYKRPDWFVLVDGTRLYKNRELRQSYVL